MTHEFNDPFKELEQSVIEDMKKRYSEKTIDHFLNPRNLGRIAAPDGFARVVSTRGNTMEIYLKVKDGRITNASFWTDGCGCAIAAGSVATELAKQKTAFQAQRITPQDILEALEGLPDDDAHNALLAANALKVAIIDYFASQNDPWKRAYRSSRSSTHDENP